MKSYLEKEYLLQWSCLYRHYSKHKNNTKSRLIKMSMNTAQITKKKDAKLIRELHSEWLSQRAIWITTLLKTQKPEKGMLMEYKLHWNHETVYRNMARKRHQAYRTISYGNDPCLHKYYTEQNDWRRKAVVEQNIRDKIAGSRKQDTKMDSNLHKEGLLPRPMCART